MPENDAGRLQYAVHQFVYFFFRHAGVVGVQEDDDCYRLWLGLFGVLKNKVKHLLQGVLARPAWGRFQMPGTYWAIEIAFLQRFFQSRQCFFTAGFCIPRVHAASSQVVRLSLMAVPTFAILVMAIVVLRHFWRVDEFMRCLMLECFAVAGAFAFMSSLTYGIFEIAGFPKISMCGGGSAEQLLSRIFANRPFLALPESSPKISSTGQPKILPMARTKGRLGS